MTKLWMVGKNLGTKGMAFGLQLVIAQAGEIMNNLMIALGLVAIGALGLSQNEAQAQTSNCTAFKNLVNTNTNAGPLLQKCLNDLPSGATLSLPPGVYNISGSIRFNKPLTLRTLGVAPGSPRCGLSESNRCATFQYVYTHLSAIADASYTVAAPAVHFDHVIFSGAKSSTARTSFCGPGPGRKPHGGTIRILSSDGSIVSSVLKNAPCYTALEVTKGVDRFQFKSNLVAYNGSHNVKGLWSDGVTVHDGVGHVVTDNILRDNTDVDLIFGGCQSCTIARNRIEHSTSREGSSFAAFLLYAWSTTSGDYSGSNIINNVVDCGINKRCGYGIGIGGKPWRDAFVRGGNVSNNTVNNAMIGMFIDGVTAPMNVEENKIDNSGGEFRSACTPERYFLPLSISNSSAPNIRGNISNLTAAQTSTQSLRNGCILNFWNEEPLIGTPRHLVENLYLGFLGRSPESNAAVDGWSRYFNANGLAKTVQAIAQSTESRRRNVNERAIVVATYRALLGRAPESEDVVQNWMGYLKLAGANTYFEVFITHEEVRRKNAEYY